MARVKRGVTSKARHKKVLKKTKGQYGARSRLIKVAKQAAIKAGQYAYRDRRKKKSTFRSLWIVRINAAARQNNLSYSKLMHGLRSAGVEIDRKMLADLDVHDNEAFKAISDKAKSALETA
jgi:large subunit ribosomal protein L20